MAYLFLGLIPLVFFLSKSKLSSSILRITSFSLIVLAILEPVLEEKIEKKEVSVLFDVSKSITDEGKEALLDLIEDNAELLFYPFGKTLASPSKSLKNYDDLSELTDFEASLKELSLRHSNSSFLLASDGIETSGNYKNVITELRNKKISLFPLVPEIAPFKKKNIRISFLNAPLLIKSKEKVPISLSVENEFDTKKSTRLKLLLDKKEIFNDEVSLDARKEKAFEFKTEELEGGLYKIKAQLINDNKVIHQRFMYLSVQEPKKVLLLSGEDDDSQQIREALGKLGYEYLEFKERELKKLPIKLDSFRSIILNNAKKDSLREGFLSELKTYVANGGGLLVLAGDRSFGLGGYINSELEEISPVSFIKPQKKKKSLKKAVILLIDKSRSMAKGDRMTAAKKAAFFSIKAMKDEDYIGVIGFDTGPFEVLALDKAVKVKKIAEERLTNRLTPVGGTSLLDSLSLAKRRLRAVNTGVKHIIVLGDGEFQDGSSSLYFEEIEAARRAGITISTIALGGEADVPFMRRMATEGGGSFYQSISASRLPEIFLQDIKVSSGELTLKEQTDFPVSKTKDLMITKLSSFPDLRGFVESKIKENATLELKLKSRNKDFPLLASWKYQKGKVITFSSDLNGRWSKRWLQWREYSGFLRDLFNELKSISEKADKEINYDFRHKLESGNLIMELSVFDKIKNDDFLAKITTPNKKEENVNFIKEAEGRYIANLKNATAGDYFIEIKNEKTTLPKIGVHLSGEEFLELPGKGINLSLLSDLASKTGGTINPTDFSAKKSFEIKRSSLLPYLLILAFFLIILEAFLHEGVLRNMLKRSTIRNM